MWQEVERFQAQGESGTFYVVVAYRMQLPFNSLGGGGRKPLAGPIDYRLADGSDVSPIGVDDSEGFKIVETDERIWKR